jgi:hypothetical protein
LDVRVLINRQSKKEGDEDVSVRRSRDLFFIFSEHVKRLSKDGMLINGAVHAEIITDISDQNAPNNIFSSQIRVLFCP